MARIDFQRAAEAFVRAFNESEFDQLAGLLTDDVVYEEITTPFEATTRDATIRRLRQMKEITPPQLRARVENWIIDEESNAAFGRIVWIFADRPVALGFLELAFNQNNTITRIREWLFNCGSVVIPPTE